MEFESPCRQVDECICCTEIGAVKAESEKGDHLCITESQIFIANCLNRHVLHVSMYEYLQNVGTLNYNQPPHENVKLLLILNTKHYGIVNISI